MRSLLNARGQAFSPGLQSLLQGLFIAAAYFLVAKLGLAFAVIAGNVTLIWPPTGLALFALLVFGLRFWPWVFLGAFLISLTTDVPVATAVLIAIGNCLEAVTGAYLLRLARFQPGLRHVRDVVLLIVLAAGISTMISATVGTASLYLGQVIPSDRLGYAWLVWWMGDAMGDLVFASLFLSWWYREKGLWQGMRALEALILVFLLAVVSQLIFGGHFFISGRPLPIAFATFPLLIWSALRMGMVGATTSTLIIGAIALINILRGVGVFAQGLPFESLLLLWLYTNVLAVTSMVLAAAVAERRLAEENMRHLAQHDALTGLPNRIMLLDRIEQAIAHAIRRHSQVAILFVDIDRFKIINDSLGHTVGDQFLIQVANLLRQNLREGDTVTRHGGDEFVIVLDDVIHYEDINTVAEKILKAMGRSFFVQGIQLHSTASIGISLYPNDGADGDTLLKNADIAMYRAKDLGRNNFVYYSAEMNARAVERLSLENKLRQALERGEFSLYYQPQFDARSGRVVGAEALLRWHNPEGEWIYPAIFVPLLEETGLIKTVGAWALDAACSQLAKWRAKGWDHLRMSVNISSRQISDPQLVEQVSRALVKHNLPPNRLELEITESLLVHQDAATDETLQRLVDLGIRLAVDDFGTGYSSLSYLHELSINTLKIDRSFVRGIPANENSVAIARAIIGLGQSLHLDLIAEGVETEEQRQYLLGIGCSFMQGNLLGNPVPARDFTKLMETSALLSG